MQDQEPSENAPAVQEQNETAMSSQPVSVHEHAADRWTIVAAVLGVLLLAILIVGGLYLLPDPDARDNDTPTTTTERDGRDRDRDNNRDDDDTKPSSTVRNPVTPERTMSLMTVVNAEQRQAMCNDGTPAKYYFRPGTEANKHKWIIYFQGGGGCGSEETCLDRAANEKPELMSSLTYKATQNNGGILSSDSSENPDFAGWNHVKLMYCSSDTWSGDAVQEIGGQTWYFKGKSIVEAVIEDLKNSEVIKTANLSQASELIVAGSSAGGSGAGHNMDDIAAGLPNTAIKGVIDSSWSYEIENPYQVTENNEDRVRQEINDFLNKELDDSCVAANTDDPGKCTFLATVYPYLETPTFIFMNQYDQLKLGNLGVNQPFDASEEAWLANEYVPNLLSTFEVIDDGLFAPRQTFHTMLTSARYFNTTIGDTTIAQAFTNWYFGRPGQTYLIEN